MYIELHPKCLMCGHSLEISRILIDVDKEDLMVEGACPTCRELRYARMPISELYVMAVEMKIKNEHRIKRGDGGN